MQSESIFEKLKRHLPNSNPILRGPIELGSIDQLYDIDKDQQNSNSGLLIPVNFEGVPVTAENLAEFLAFLSSREKTDNTLIFYNVKIKDDIAIVGRGFEHDAFINTLEEKKVLIYLYRNLNKKDEDREYILLPKSRNEIYDLLLKGPSGLTIFEHNAQTKLQSDLQPDKPGQPNGYMIPNSHFRLGSKIHISHFYYAKRLFQNNFYALRFAFLIVDSLIRNKTLDDVTKRYENGKKGEYEDGEKGGKNGLTLIGYGIYSELLLSHVSRLVQEYLPQKMTKINHELVSDEEQFRLLKNVALYDQAIMIIPISTTFSTSIKIDEILKEQNSDIYVHTPHITLLNVCDQNRYEDPKIILTPQERKFGWAGIDPDRRRVFIKRLNKDEEKDKNNDKNKSNVVEQQYFIRLPTHWHDVQDCTLCFNEKDPINEFPLFTTDKTSITPALIFDIPRGRKLDEGKHSFTISDQMIRYGHYDTPRTHYLFYFDKEAFFNGNKQAIKKWLEEKENDIKGTDAAGTDKDKYVIMAPGNHTNSGFVNLVNEVIFDNKANIIHFDSSHDHVLNFMSFYKDELTENNGSQIKLFYVDDTIDTGTSFSLTNDLVEYAASTKGKGKDTGRSSISFHGAIIMMNRSGFFSHERIISKLANGANTLYSFANLHLSSSNDFDNSCALCKEEERYEKLYHQSFLDRMKKHFLDQGEKIEKKYPDSAKDPAKAAHLRRLKGMHVIYRWFSESENARKFNEFVSLENWMEDVRKFMANNVPFEISIQANDSEMEYIEISVQADDSEMEYTYLKILTQSPFIHYAPVKKTVFRWVIELLDNHIKDIESNPFEYTDFTRLKFLIRRAGMISSNYLISLRMMSALNKICGDNGIPKLIKEFRDKEDKKNELSNLLSFPIFFAAQIKELLFMNEARSIQLEKVLADAHKSKENSTMFKSIARILRLENGIIIQHFIDHIRKDFSASNPNRFFYDDKKNIVDDNSRVKGFLETSPVSSHYRYKTLLAFLKPKPKGTQQGEKPEDTQQKEELALDHPFMSYLYLLNFMEFEQEEDMELSEKTNVIINKLKEILYGNTEENGQYAQTGALFLVKYKTEGADSYFFAHNEGANGKIDFNPANDREHYFVKFLDGISDDTEKAKLTIDELQKKTPIEEGGWQSMYATTPTIQISNIPDGYNRLILIRINTPPNGNGTEHDDAQGLIVFYFRTEPEDNITDIEKSRLLLLLREPLSNFIRNHHQNSEFRDWIEADKKSKLIHLTGHSREMLLALALNKSKDDGLYQKIVLHTEHLQMITQIDRDLHSKAGIHTPQRKLFDQFYRPYANKGIDRSVIERIAEMAKELFSFNEIENQVDCGITLIYDKNIKFPFSKHILNMICFELFINAKKNRWHFLKGETVPLPEKTIIVNPDKKKINIIPPSEDCPDDNPEISINQLNIRILIENDDKNKSEEDGKLIIEIINTGPTVPNSTFELLKQRNPKENSDIAGLELIRVLLKRNELGTIEFGQGCGDAYTPRLTTFKVRLLLRNKYKSQYLHGAEEYSIN